MCILKKHLEAPGDLSGPLGQLMQSVTAKPAHLQVRQSGLSEFSKQRWIQIVFFMKMLVRLMGLRGKGCWRLFLRYWSLLIWCSCGRCCYVWLFKLVGRKGHPYPSLWFPLLAVLLHNPECFWTREQISHRMDVLKELTRGFLMKQVLSGVGKWDFIKMGACFM